jgi:hypothetical protein
MLSEYILLVHARVKRYGAGKRLEIIAGGNWLN